MKCVICNKIIKKNQKKGDNYSHFNCYNKLMKKVSEEFYKHKWNRVTNEISYCECCNKSPITLGLWGDSYFIMSMNKWKIN